MARRLWMTTLIGVALFVQSPLTHADRALAREWVREGTLKLEEGALEEALARYEQAIRSDPDYVAAYEKALPLWLRLGHEGRARQELERLTLRCPHCAFAWYALGALYRRAQRYDLAVLAYDAYLSRRPKDPDGRFGLAMALQASDDPRALAALERYVALENRRERRPYRDEALRRIAEHRARLATTEMRIPPRLQDLLECLAVLKPLAEVVWGAPSAVDDDEDHGPRSGTPAR